MKFFIVKIKSNRGDEEVTSVLCIEADTYAVAEQTAYAWAEGNCDGSFMVDSVVKSQIKEILIEEDFTSLYFFLVKYEFGLESKPEKSNVLVNNDSLNRAFSDAENYLNGFCDGLFIPELKKTDIQEFISYPEVKILLNIKDEEEEGELVVEGSFEL